MTARIIDGVALARTIRDEVAVEAAKFAALGMKPGLAVVLIGEDPASFSAGDANLSRYCGNSPTVDGVFAVSTAE